MTSRAQNLKLNRVENVASITTTGSTPRGAQLPAHSLLTRDAFDRVEAGRDFLRDDEHELHPTGGAEQDFASSLLTRDGRKRLLGSGSIEMGLPKAKEQRQTKGHTDEEHHR